MDGTVKRHLICLIAIALLFKIFTLLLTTNTFHSFFDIWDFGVYFDRAMQTSMGAIPYADYQFDYPPIALIPVFVAFLVWKIYPVGLTFVVAFDAMMIACDILTVMGIYAIALHVWKKKQRAFVAALLYACSLPVAYFTLTRFDALPVMILVWGVLFMLKREVTQSYFTMLVGFITKIFPAVTIPYMMVWNMDRRDTKQDIIKVAGMACILIAIIAIPFMFGGAGFFDVFDVVHKTALHANTPIYLIHMYIGSLSTDLITIIGYVLAGIGYLALFWYISKNKGNERVLLKTLMLAIFIAVMVAPQHSPQYVMWYTPFLCLLVSGEASMIGLLIVTQIMTYLEFPILFNVLYDNGGYIPAAGSAWWGITVSFFTLKYLLLISLMYGTMKLESKGERYV